MEIPGIPELNQSTLEEKADSARQKKDLSLPDIGPHLSFSDLGTILLIVLITAGVVVFLIDHVFKGNEGAKGPGQTLPNHLVSK